MKSSLIFVYNAKTGKTNALSDFLHKTFRPETYPCNLCKVTYGLFSEKLKWKKYSQSKDIEMKFLYKDEFERSFDLILEYPVIVQAPEMKVFMSRNDLNQIEELDQLIQSIDKRLTGLNSAY